MSFVEEERHASWLELFFDLVFVLVVAQVAAALHDDLSAAGFVRFVIVFLPVWWAWVGFSFYVSRFPREDTGVRALMLTAMLAAAILAANVRGALTHDTAVGFALSYAGLRACLVLLYVRARREPAARELADFYAAGFGLGAALWAVSAAVSEPARYAVWALAFVIEAATPALAGERLVRAPPIHATHLPERFGLFVIIVLGEAIVAVGAGFSEFGSTPETALAGSACFALAAAVWWTYFDFAGRSIRPGLRSSLRRGAFARDIYSYAHLPIVVGIAAASVGAEDAIAHANDDHLHAAVCWTLAGGLATYLLALAAIHALIGRDNGGSRLAGVPLAAALAALTTATVGTDVPPLVFLGVLLIVLSGELGLHAAWLRRSTP
jgi:low temperature requirement protein LtrA